MYTNESRNRQALQYVLLSASMACKKTNENDFSVQKEAPLSLSNGYGSFNTFTREKYALILLKSSSSGKYWMSHLVNFSFDPIQ